MMMVVAKMLMLSVAVITHSCGGRQVCVRLVVGDMTHVVGWGCVDRTDEIYIYTYMSIPSP